MEVIHETQTIHRPIPSNPVASDFTPRVLSDMERKFQELQQGAIKTMKEATQNPEADDMITKRNAAQILVIALGQKKQFLFVSAAACFLTAIFGSVWGAFGAFIPFAIFAIFATYTFMNNEKEIKAYKEKFSL